MPNVIPRETHAGRLALPTTSGTVYRQPNIVSPKIQIPIVAYAIDTMYMLILAVLHFQLYQWHSFFQSYLSLYN